MQFSTVSSLLLSNISFSLSHSQSQSLLKEGGHGGDQLKGHLEAVILVVITSLISVWFTDAGVVELDNAIGLPDAC